MEDLVLIVPHVNLRRSLTIIMSVLPVKAMELIYPPKIKHVFPATNKATLSILTYVLSVTQVAEPAMVLQQIASLALMATTLSCLIILVPNVKTQLTMLTIQISRAT